MHKSRFVSLLLVVAVGTFFSISPCVGDDAPTPPSLDEVHQLLQQAADAYKADTPPVASQQIDLLSKAAKMLTQIPKGGYHGALKSAIRSINSAIDEIKSGDTAHKAREDIFDADDAVKSVM